MNGEPLPLDHGFPVRMLAPGLYGYVGACKWLTSMTVSTFDAFDPYWVQRGWATDATQTDQRAAPFPDGATGWHSTTMTVT
ncbi:molybdopterin-dependent oxidoreductase [Micromonospora sp. WMMD1155]|uniref:molybdopterin-dependent oxidoreductase n=1 Tax=Micromonospora sp. WMMD1155 TaxID=3016094 RepID=UPI00249BB567|nr:molybdopterin-dependent oxidoreductase [Micromonospora sp. WMMD1155]WFE53229.1 molybdopterin-dependent oxidoreductase [Micromonospora sp. WMMD1155]